MLLNDIYLNLAPLNYYQRIKKSRQTIQGVICLQKGNSLRHGMNRVFKALPRHIKKH